MLIKASGEVESYFVPKKLLVTISTNEGSMKILGALNQRLEDIGRRFTVEVFGRDIRENVFP